MQIMQIILIALTCKFMYFILDKILKLDLLHAFLSLVVAKLPDLKNTPVLLAHSV